MTKEVKFEDKLKELEKLDKERKEKEKEKVEDDAKNQSNFLIFNI